MKQVSILLCFRYLQHRRIVLLSIAAVALSCALLISTDSLFTGFINAFENSFNRHFGDIVIQAPSEKTITEYDSFIYSLCEADCIESATAVLSTQGLLLTAPGKVSAVQAWGIELPRRLSVTPLHDALLFQKDTPVDQVGFSVPGEPDAVGGIVGIGVLAEPDEMTDQYDMDSIRKMLGQSMVLTTGSIVRQQSEGGHSQSEFSRKVIRFKLADVSRSGMYEFDHSFAMFPIDVLSKSLYPDQPVSANFIHVRLTPGADEEKAVAVISGIWRSFAENRFGWSSFVTIKPTSQLNARVIAEYKKQMDVLLFIFELVSAGIILLVFCIFYLIVITRRKDVGVLKSCGVSSGSVAGLFVLFGVVVGIVGAVLGIGLGWLIIDNVNVIEHTIASVFGLKLWKASTYYFSQIPNTMNWGSVLWITAAGVIAAAIGSLIPAVAAARVKPVETLQYE